MKPLKLEELRESAVLLAQAPPALARGTLYGFLILFGMFLAWSFFVQVPMIVTAEGRIRPADRIRLVDAEVGGRVAQVSAEEHQQVEAGQLLIALDPKPLQLELSAIDREIGLLAPERTELQLISAALARYERGKEPKIEGLQRWRDRFNLFLRELDLAVVTMQRKQEDLRRIESLENVVTAAELSTARQAVLEAGSAYLLSLAKHRAETERGLEETVRRLDALEVMSEQKKDQLKRLEIRSPLKGTVTFVAVRHVGEVVKPGELLFHVAPAGSRFLAEVWVPGRQAGFVVPKVEARVVIPTFPEASFGYIAGTVRAVAPDASSLASGDTQAEPLYRVEIDLATDELHARDGRTGRLRLGLQTRARLLVRHERLLFRLIGTLKEAFRWGA